MSTLQDILNEDLTNNQQRILVQRVFENTITTSARTSLPRSKTPGSAKSLLEFYDLVRLAKDDYETRQDISDEYKIIFTEEEPDIESETETITFGLVKRVPGAFGQGSPFEADVKNMRPVFRETGADVENPGYNYAVHGYWYDNIVKFTCWAQTNKAANTRAEWFESLMSEYDWWFKLQGVNRVLFWGRDADIVTVIDNNKWYGRPLNYFVRTEKLRVFSEKQMEEILIRLAVKTE